VRIAITGASGLLGHALTDHLARAGHDVVPLVRRYPPSLGEVGWDPASGRIERDKLQGTDAVVHLAGASIATRWTRRRQAAIRASRVDGTRLIAATLASLVPPPRVLVSASAVGYYGAHGDERIDESAPPGTGFLAEVARAWEEATSAAQGAGIRTVHARFGVMLAREGGALAKMLPAFRLGLGGRVGSGRQGFSWIGLIDAVRAVHRLLVDGTLRGPVNVVAPEPVSQADFARALGRALHRPAFVPLPAGAVRAAFGRMGEETLLGGAFVVPAVLRRAGFTWEAPGIDDALRLALDRTS